MEAARIGYTAQPWPRQYLAAKQQLERNFERERGQAGSALAEQANRALGV
jgi:anthraniloyl-CoA monooxygenase